MFGRDPVVNIDLMLKHHDSGHIATDEDPSIYKECLLSALHAAWTAAATFNAKRSSDYKKQYDKSGHSPLSIAVGDRVFLRNFVPTPGRSPKLCLPWLGQFRVIAVNHPHVTIVSITSPQSPPKRVHLNQVKKCFELTGPVFTSPWAPIEENDALTDLGALPATITGYNHEVPPTSSDVSVPQFSHPYATRFRKRITSL
ncbi:hypothetical protein Q1695_003275 [Nippostrongylus brasiliensis]|nr:hypothetical protein Q1695_003275 [Nippostrongylus brasiliensis]